MLCICVNWTQGSTQHLSWGAAVYSQNRHVWSYETMYVMAWEETLISPGKCEATGNVLSHANPRSSLTCMYLHAHWRIPAPLPGSRKPHSDRLIVCNKRGEVWWDEGEGGRVDALPVGCEPWHLGRVYGIYTGLPLPGLRAPHVPALQSRAESKRDVSSEAAVFL